MRYYDPKATEPRNLVCTGCRETLLVVEHPVTHIDPRRYRCDRCRDGRPPGQLELEGVRTDHCGYQNTMAMVPY